MCVHVYLCVCVYVCAIVYMYICVCMRIIVYVYMCVCMCVVVYMCVCGGSFPPSKLPDFMEIKDYRPNRIQKGMQGSYLANPTVTSVLWHPDFTL